MSANLETRVHAVREDGAFVIPFRFLKRGNARRYILRVNAEGVACVTIPRGGSQAEAERFVDRNRAWLAAQLRRHEERSQKSLSLDKILFRGEPVAVVVEPGCVRVGDQPIPLNHGMADLRAQIKQGLWRLAWIELPERVGQLAVQHGLIVKRVSVRDQRSRWGSCSARGVISLNWRLIQAPEFVRDYIMVHELMHLREMNHSARFWKLVHEAFPGTPAAESWLKAESGLLRQL